MFSLREEGVERVPVTESRETASLLVVELVCALLSGTVSKEEARDPGNPGNREMESPLARVDFELCIR